MIGKLSVAAVLMASPCLAGPGWSVATPIPTPRRGAVGSIIKSKAVVVSGENPSIANAGVVTEIYDPLSEEWTDGPKLDSARSDAAAAPIGETMYIAGGVDSNGRALSRVQALDFKNKHNPDWGWTDTAPLPEAREGLALAPVPDAAGNEALYAVGGFENGAYTNRVDIYSPATNKWTPGPSLNIARRDHGSAIVNGNLYVVGGCTSTNASALCEPLNSVEMLNTTSGKWQFVAPMPSPRHGMNVASFSTDIIVLAGSTSSGIDASDSRKGLTNTVLWLDTNTNTWQEIAPALPDPRDGVVKGFGLELGIIVFLIGGTDKTGAYSPQVDQYALRC